jgi:hypothetical protein
MVRLRPCSLLEKSEIQDSKAMMRKKHLLPSLLHRRMREVRSNHKVEMGRTVEGRGATWRSGGLRNSYRGFVGRLSMSWRCCEMMCMYVSVTIQGGRSSDVVGSWNASMNRVPHSI